MTLLSVCENGFIGEYCEIGNNIITQFCLENMQEKIYGLFNFAVSMLPSSVLLNFFSSNSSFLKIKIYLDNGRFFSWAILSKLGRGNLATDN